MGNRDITVIGPKTTLPKAFMRRRVALYARVSTDRAEQENSLAAQIDYFEKRIALNPNWVSAGVFYDDGISGLGYRGRPGFDTMIEQAKTGNIDLILTKSISRFARNTVDTIQTIRDLKAANVEVNFQKEDIFTFESKGEFVLTLMSCFAQEESRSISENVKWGIRKAFADGRYSVPYSRFLGYDKGNMETPLIINNNESLIVKSIVLLFLEGFSTTGIASVLAARGIPAPGGKERWHPSTIYSIITNEKYRGDALLQKTYIENFLTKKARKNKGELPKYYVTDGHEAIIPRSVDAIIQPEISARKSLNMSFSGNKLFSQKIRCKCGSYYGHRTSRHGNTPKYTFSFWRCIDHYKGGYHDKAVREDILFRTVSNRLEMCFRSQEITEAIMEIIESPNVQNKIAAESIWLEMISGDEPELFYDFGTWRFIIRQITVDNPRSPKVDFIWRSSNQNRNY